jgi:hypothetical protein
VRRGKIHAVKRKTLATTARMLSELGTSVKSNLLHALDSAAPSRLLRRAIVCEILLARNSGVLAHYQRLRCFYGMNTSGGGRPKHARAVETN